MNAKISGFAICVEAIMYLLLHNFHDCTFKMQDNLQYLHVVIFYLTEIENKTLIFWAQLLQH